VTRPGGLLAAGPSRLPGGRRAVQAARRVRAGPLQGGLAARGARRAGALARRGLGARAVVAGGDAIGAPWHAVDGMDGIQEPQAQAGAEPRHRWPSGHRRGIGLWGRVDAGQWHVVPAGVVWPDARQGPGEPWLDCRRRQPLGDAIPLGLSRAGLPKAGQGVLAVRRLHGRAAAGPWAPARQATSAPGTGRPPLRRLNLGLRAQAPTEQPRHVRGVDGVVGGLAAVAGLPRHGRSADTRPPVAGPEVGEPRPGQEAGATDDQVRPGGGNGLEPGRGACGPLAGPKAGPILGHQTEGPGTRGQVDTTIQGVLLGGEAPAVSSSCA